MSIIEPRLPVQAMQTYRILSPMSTHWRPATCAEVDCEHYLHGWVTTIDESTVLGQQQAYFIRNNRSGFTESRTEGGLTTFTFEAGQRCFASSQHQVRLDRPEHYRRHDGDWRGNPTGRVIDFRDAQSWVDDFGEHQESLAEIARRG